MQKKINADILESVYIYINFRKQCRDNKACCLFGNTVLSLHVNKKIKLGVFQFFLIFISVMYKVIIVPDTKQIPVAH